MGASSDDDRAAHERSQSALSPPTVGIPCATYAIYLDDERDPKTGGLWAVARDFAEAVSLCSPRAPYYISFDHDLGDGPSGYDFAKWLVEQDLEAPGFLPEGFSFNVHSANPVGRDNIVGLLSGYLAARQTAPGPNSANT